MNPGVVSANYDRIIREKRGRINQYKGRDQRDDRPGGGQEAEAAGRHRGGRTPGEAQGGRRGKSAAQVAAKHNGDPEATRKDPEYLKCQTAFKDFSSTLTEKQARAQELEGDIEELLENINRHKTQIQSQMRELEKLGEEKHDAVVATILSAKEEKEIADLMSGISEDRTGEELRELRELRNKAAAGARVSRELGRPRYEAGRERVHGVRRHERGERRVRQADRPDGETRRGRPGRGGEDAYPGGLTTRIAAKGMTTRRHEKTQKEVSHRQSFLCLLRLFLAT